jgi:hypothetical protein
MLTTEQIKLAEKISIRDYEVRTLLQAYKKGVLDQEGIDLLIEEITYR